MMCTAIFDNKYGSFFGRTLDLEFSYGEEVTKVEKSEEISFIYEGKMDSRFGFVGMSHNAVINAECKMQNAKCIRRTESHSNTKNDGCETVSLFYDGMNESGLCVAALNFPHFCKYAEHRTGVRNLSSFEVIPFILANCGNVGCVEKLFGGANITSDDFSDKYPSAPLHWMVADRERSIVIEQTEDGLRIHENPVGVMTNSPPFPWQMARLGELSGLSARQHENTLYPNANLKSCSNGLGGIGLPGDFSSFSRFARAAFVKEHTLLPSIEGATQEQLQKNKLNRFWQIIGSVSVPLGCVLTDSGKPVSSIYTSCCDMDNLEYHYFLYGEREVKSIKL